MMDLAFFDRQKEQDEIERLKKRIKELEDKEEKPQDIFEEMDGGSRKFSSRRDE